jgi:integrase/recombinase XerD
MNARDAALLDEFCDQLWLEDGLAKNTLEAYRRDLALFADWLAGRGKALDAAAEPEVLGYLAFRHQGARRVRASTQAPPTRRCGSSRRSAPRAFRRR